MRLERNERGGIKSDKKAASMRKNIAVYLENIVIVGGACNIVQHIWLSMVWTEFVV